MSTYFFLHIPKAGGTSFSRHLTDSLPASRLIKIPNNENCLERSYEHHEGNVYSGHQFYPFHRLLPRDVKIITFLRHPVKRVISAYEYIKFKTSHIYHDLLVQQNIASISAFIEDDFFLFHANNMQTRMLGLDYDFIDILSKYTAGIYSIQEAKDEMIRHEKSACSSEMLETAKRRLRTEVYFFGITEWFEISVNAFCSMEKITHPKTLYTLNRTSEYTKTTEHYSELEIDAICSANLYDISLYNYACDLFKERFGHLDNSWKEGIL